MRGGDGDGAVGGDLTGGARLAAERIAPDQPAANDKSVNNTTTVTFPAAGNAPLVVLRLLNEGTLMKSYKIDVPDSLDANRLVVDMESLYRRLLEEKKVGAGGSRRREPETRPGSYERTSASP